MSATGKLARSGLFLNTGEMRRYFKAAFEGFAGAGKSFTMALVALGIREQEGGKPALLMIDTEESSKFLIPLFEDAGLVEGEHLFVSRSRSLADFQQILTLAEEEHAILLIDSLTHLHEEMVRQYLSDQHRKHLEMRDHMVLKSFWKERFSVPYMRANCHALFTGRAAWEYEPDRDDDTGKATEFYKSGIKMRGDNETAFEPDMLVLMTRRQEGHGRATQVWREAMILKSRYSPLDGKVLKNPSFEDFEPIYRFVMNGTQDGVRGPETTMAGVFTDPPRTRAARRRHIDALLGELKGLYDSYLPGMGAKERKLKADVAYVAFGKRSWEALEQLSLEELKVGAVIAESLLAQIDAVPDEPKEIVPWLRQRRDEFLAGRGGDHPAEWDI